jgi:hypothetical protein
LYFYQARWYDPALGRFAQADTIIPGSDAISFDRYSYVRNNPINFGDPSGHFACGDGFNDQRCGGEYDPFLEYSKADYNKLILSKFGVTMSDSYETWNFKNTVSMYIAMEVMNNALNGNLKLVARGWGMRFRQTPYRGIVTSPYEGETAGAFIDFYADTQGIPYQNIYHEFGHLVNDGAVGIGMNIVGSLLSARVYDAYGRFVLGNNGTAYERTDSGYTKAYLWDPNRNASDIRALQHPTATNAQGQRTEPDNANEEWPDIWANYVAKNIDMASPQGRARSNWISSILAPIRNSGYEHYFQNPE